MPSYGTQNPHTNSYSINIPMTEIHTHKDGILETTCDSIGPSQAHTVYYNICQVWRTGPQVWQYSFKPSGLVQEKNHSWLLLFAPWPADPNGHEFHMGHHRYGRPKWSASSSWKAAVVMVELRWPESQPKHILLNGSSVFLWWEKTELWTKS